MQRITYLTARVSAAVAVLALTAAVAAAQGTNPSYKHDVPAKLAKLAKISEDSAAKVAQAKIPNGKIEAVELESEKGKLQYSYDIKVAGKSGIEEVNVSAMDGTIVGVEHESAAKVKAERAAEKLEKKTP
jgi:uncharacterized membrane protein YkoI